MNKTALLHMVRNVSALSEQNVEELEKLVKNFPYCQTAHLLIAKAAYDKGNMLSNQKLRKAAAYATNRQLLKKLIYTTDSGVPLTAIEDLNYAKSAQPDNDSLDNSSIEVENTAVINQDKDVSGTSITTTHDVDLTIANAEADQNFKNPKEQELTEPTIDLPTKDDSTGIETDKQLASIDDVEVLTEPENAAPVELNSLEELVNNSLDEQNLTTNEDIILLPTFESANSLTLAELEEMLQIEKWTNDEYISEPLITELETLVEDSPIAEQDSQQPTTPTEIIRYELEVPEDLEETVLDQTLARFDSYLFKPEKDEFFNSELKPATTEEFIQEVYLTNQVGYWMGSSRLGELLQVKDELTHHTPLQFYPDLILEYSKQNYLTPTDPPKTSPANRQFEIIDQFLKLNPKLKSFSTEKMRAEPQDDLAFKSTKNTKNLASENLANIMVQQGKIKKAIKIYEHLIVKIPEKRAYFAAQIEKLRNQI